MHSDVCIVGAGIVGLATAYRLLEQRPELKIQILEKEKTVAAHQTGHNSGVIHSGIYYKPGSLKAKNCFAGYKQLLAFCRSNDIKHDVCGKIIVATEDKELPILEGIMSRGRENGLEGLSFLDKDELKAKEPHVNGIKGIWVPQAGIINYKSVADKLKERISEFDGVVTTNEKVVGIRAAKGIVNIETSIREHSCRLMINCAGLYSDVIALMTVPDLDMRIIPFRGEYYKLKETSKNLVENLIYPVPDPNFPFLGVHFTRMISGDIEAGPNAVLAFRKEGYSNTDFDLSEFASFMAWPGFRKVSMKYWRTGLMEMHRSFSKAAFVQALKKLIPEITEDDLVEGGSGVRAQAIDHKGNLVDDFAILESSGVINVCNAPSPAATSNLAIGQTISEKALTQL